MGEPPAKFDGGVLAAEVFSDTHQRGSLIFHVCTFNLISLSPCEYTRVWIINLPFLFWFFCFGGAGVFYSLRFWGESRVDGSWIRAKSCRREKFFHPTYRKMSNFQLVSGVENSLTMRKVLIEKSQNVIEFFLSIMKPLLWSFCKIMT